MRIVIVEDEGKIRAGMAGLIRRHTGHTIVGEAKNGREGLETILRENPDLVLTDIRMPEMDGLEMLAALDEMGVRVHAVILSGYSEFEYAKKAIRYGAEDYLLKPIGAEDVTELLGRVGARLEEEARAREALPESALRGLLLGEAEAQAACRQLTELCRFGPSTRYVLLLGYITAPPAVYKKWFDERVGPLAPPPCQCITFFAEQMHKLVCFVAGLLDTGALLAAFGERLLGSCQGLAGQAVWCAAAPQTPMALRPCLARLQELLPYGIPLGPGRLLDEAAVAAFAPEPYAYPAALQSSIQAAVCGGGETALEEGAKAFIAHMRQHRYAPQDTRHAYIKLATLLINLLHEIYPAKYAQVQGTDPLGKLVGACTLGELERVLEQMVALFSAPREKKEDLHSYTIKRALGYIREHYQEGISLEETAQRLQITPEYLSTLFNKEMGVNFSTFLKQFRLSHAKRLLKGTGLKVYEIAERVGYSDPKYFTRVFKEELGLSPGEYRQNA